MIKDNIKRYADEFEKKLDAAFSKESSEYSILNDACRYSLLLGGKRLRPFLIREFYKLCGGKEELSINFEIATECIHTYSLIHDDLPCMDDDDTRRGKPSCHIKFGEANALLAGDALLTAAFGIAAASDERLGAENILKAAKLLSDHAGIDGMIGGQVVDLLYEHRRADEDILKLICSLKTGALIKVSCLIGCVLAGADEEKQAAAKKYAENIGLAFQIVDDILDETGDEAKLGKPVHSDKSNEKSTFVSFLGIEECRRLVLKLTNEAKSALDIFGARANNLKELADYLCLRDY